MKKVQVREILIFLNRITHSESVSYSWRLALAVLIAASNTKTHTDIERSICLALLHDLPNAKSPANRDTEVRGITDDLSFGDWVYGMWREYEDQKTVEAQFVKSVSEIVGGRNS